MTAGPGKTAVVAGSTGLIGRELIRQLSSDPVYSQVLAITRRPGLFAGLAKVKEIPFPTGDQPIVADVFFCALGTTIKKAGSQRAFRTVDYDMVMDLARRALRGGVKRVAVVTAIGSEVNSPFFYSRVKGELERDLKTLGLPRLEIYQPSLLLGERDEFRFGERFGEMLSYLITPTLVGPLRKYRPIHGAEVARRMIAGEPLF